MVTCLNQNIITNTEEKQISPLSTLAWSAGASTTESGLLSRKKEGKKENPQQTQPGHFTQNRQEDWKHSPPMSEGTAGISVLQTPLQLHKTWGDNFSICWRHTRKHTCTQPEAMQLVPCAQKTRSQITHWGLRSWPSTTTTTTNKTQTDRWSGSGWRNEADAVVFRSRSDYFPTTYLMVYLWGVTTACLPPHTPHPPTLPGGHCGLLHFAEISHGGCYCWVNIASHRGKKPKPKTITTVRWLVIADTVCVHERRPSKHGCLNNGELTRSSWWWVGGKVLISASPKL